MRTGTMIFLAGALIAASTPAMAKRTPFDATIDRSSAPVCAEKRVVFKLSRQWLAQLLEMHGAAAPQGQIRVEIRGNSLNVRDLDRVYRYKVVGDDRVQAIGHDFPTPIVLRDAPGVAPKTCS